MIGFNPGGICEGEDMYMLFLVSVSSILDDHIFNYK